MIHTHESRIHLGDDTERNAVILLARVRAVTSAMQVGDHVVLAGPPRHRLNGGVADHEVDHHDHRTQLLRELGALTYMSSIVAAVTLR